MSSPSLRRSVRLSSTPSTTPKSSAAAPYTPEWMAPLSRELESVIAARNLLTTRTRRRVLEDLDKAAADAEDVQVQRLRKKAVEELISSEKSYLRHLEIIAEFFIHPLKNDRSSLISQQDFVAIFGKCLPVVTT